MGDNVDIYPANILEMDSMNCSTATIIMIHCLNDIMEVGKVPRISIVYVSDDNIILITTVIAKIL